MLLAAHATPSATQCMRQRKLGSSSSSTSGLGRRAMQTPVQRQPPHQHQHQQQHNHQQQAGDRSVHVLCRSLEPHSGQQQTAAEGVPWGLLSQDQQQDTGGVITRGTLLHRILSAVNEAVSQEVTWA
jgi:hypothetical protein